MIMRAWCGQAEVDAASGAVSVTSPDPPRIVSGRPFCYTSVPSPWAKCADMHPLLETRYRGRGEYLSRQGLDVLLKPLV